ncbi:sensor histidine kinase [Arcanobacterium canis]
MMAPHDPPRWYRTLSFKLSVTFMSLLVVVFVPISFIGAQILRTHLTRKIDTELMTSGTEIATQTLDRVVNGSRKEITASDYTQILPSEYFVYVAYQNFKPFTVVGEPMRRTVGEPAHPATLATQLTQDPITVPGTKNSKWRIITLQMVEPQTNQPIGSVVIGLPTISVDAAVTNLIQMLVAFELVLGVLGGAVSFLMIRRQLRSLHAIEVATRDVASGNLSRRVPSGSSGSEVGMLGRSINVMLSQIQESFESKEASEQKMKQFVSDASHELRTPLASVNGYAQLYRMGGVPADQVPHVMARVESESTRMSHLVEDLLQLARLDEGRKLNYSDVDLASVALNAVSDFEVRAPDYPIEVTDLDGDEPQSVMIIGNEEKITQVFSNLLSNVRSHTPSGTAVEVAVGRSNQRPDSAIVEVRDHGPGIKEKDRSRVFERFFRTDTSRSRESGGSGLGLAIVSAIMQAHSGSTEVAETPGGGLTIRLTFPRLMEKPSAPEKSRQHMSTYAAPKLAKAFTSRK